MIGHVARVFVPLSLVLPVMLCIEFKERTVEDDISTYDFMIIGYEGPRPCRLPKTLYQVFSGTGGRPFVDPWGHPYNYRRLSDRCCYELYSNGPDGLPNTADDIWSKWPQGDGCKNTANPHSYSPVGSGAVGTPLDSGGVDGSDMASEVSELSDAGPAVNELPGIDAALDDTSRLSTKDVSAKPSTTNTSWSCGCKVCR